MKKNKGRQGVRKVHIHINDDEALEQGAKEVSAMLDELGAYLAQRSQNECHPLFVRHRRMGELSRASNRFLSA